MRMKTEDDALAMAAGGGDRAAFAALVDRSYDRLFRLCWRLTGARDLAEDLAQDVCLKLPRALRSYRGEAAYSTWLHRIALNAWRDARRRDGTRTRALAAYAAEAPLRAPDGQADEADAWLAAAMAALKPDLAETAALVVGEAMAQADAAEILGVSPGTIAWRMSEVKKALKAKAEAETT